MQTPHLEVIPRIIDASIAANYQKTEPLATSPEPAKVVPQQSNAKESIAPAAQVAAGAATVCAPTFTQRFFATVKDYMIPILFVIVVIICIYVLWKYFTKYRKSNEEVSTVEPVQAVIEPEKPDLSKYVFNTDSSEDEDDGEEDADDENDSKLSIIEEGSDDEEGDEEEDDDDEEEESDEFNETDADADEGETDEESGEESEDGHESLPSLITEPDLDAITNLINQSIDRPQIDTFLLDEGPERFEYISPTPDMSDNESVTENQADDSDMFNLTPEETKPKVRKARKSKRVVL